MNLYLAAVYTNGYMPGMDRYVNLNDNEKTIVSKLPYILESYHYIKNEKFVKAIREDNGKIFLDSGAFSAFTLGKNIDINNYCNYIKSNIDIIKKEDGILMASVLDGIGDPFKTYHNQLKMEYEGVKPLPCFHFGEDERFLNWYIKHYPYITIGGMVGRPAKDLIKWLDRIWDNHMINAAGNPILKVHAFGITSTKIIKRYPWYSCDSSSWIQSAAFGSIIDPKHGPIKVSEKSPSRHVQGEHASTLSPLEKKYLFNMLERTGFSYERLSTIYESRAAYNLLAFTKINDDINKMQCAIQHAAIKQELF